MTDLLRDAETDLAELAGLSGTIRAKVKAGIAELTRVRDAIDARIATLTSRAQATLASLQTLATQDAAAEVGQSSSAEPRAPVDPAAPSTGSLGA